MCLKTAVSAVLFRLRWAPLKCTPLSAALGGPAPCSLTRGERAAAGAARHVPAGKQPWEQSKATRWRRCKVDPERVFAGCFNEEARNNKVTSPGGN